MPFDQVGSPKIDEFLTELRTDPLKLALGRANRDLSGADVPAGGTVQFALRMASQRIGDLLKEDPAALDVPLPEGGVDAGNVQPLFKAPVQAFRRCRRRGT
jgi:hypothetical protein